MVHCSYPSYLFKLYFETLRIYETPALDHFHFFHLLISPFSRSILPEPKGLTVLTIPRKWESEHLTRFQLSSFISFVSQELPNEFLFPSFRVLGGGREDSVSTLYLGTLNRTITVHCIASQGAHRTAHEAIVSVRGRIWFGLVWFYLVWFGFIRFGLIGFG